MNEFKIAKARKDQMPEVAKVFKASRQHALPYLPELHSQEEDINYFSNIVFPENEIHIAQDNKSGKIVGFIAFNKDWVNHLYLLPESQKRNLGSKLLALAKDHAPALDLWTFQRNLGAQRFYEKHGFKAVKTTDGSDNEEKEPDVLLRWER